MSPADNGNLAIASWIRSAHSGQTLEVHLPGVTLTIGLVRLMVEARLTFASPSAEYLIAMGWAPASGRWERRWHLDETTPEQIAEEVEVAMNGWRKW